MKSFRWTWFVTLGAMAIAVPLFQQFLAIRAEADSSIRLVILLARTSAVVANMEQLEMQLIYEQHGGHEARQRELHRLRAEFERNVSSLPEYAWAGLDSSGLHSAYEDYKRGLEKELRSINSGELANAVALDEAVVDPAFNRLERKMDELRFGAEAAAARHIQRANARLTGFLAIGVSLTGGMFFLDGRRQKTAMLAERKGLAASEKRYRLLTERASDVVVIADRAGTVRYASPPISSVLGTAPDKAVGRSFLELVKEEDRPAVIEKLRAARESESSRIEFRGKINANDWIFLEAIVRDLTRVPEIGGLVLNLRDIDDQKRAQMQLLHTALHDDLTGLPNRLLFTERLQAALDRAGREHSRSVAVLFIDVDDFKMVNDSVGHQVGDLLILQIAQRIGTCVKEARTGGPRPTWRGLVARLGGDEFTVMLDDVRDVADAMSVCEQIRHAMHQPFQLGDGEFHATVSIGVAIQGTECTPEELMRNADVAMYRAKTHGKGRYVVFDEQMHERVAARVQLERNMRAGLERGEFVLHYQPIVCLKTGRIRRVEALLRWNRDGGIVAPAEFIPAAEECGLIRPIGDWALREACRQAAIWNHGSAERVVVCVNISGKQFTHPKFLDEVMAAIAETGVHPNQLEFEITEGVAMEDAERTRHMLGQLQAIGVQLALDDFGTGYSSLSYLRRFAVNTLKIDRSFVCDLPHNRENMAIVQTIIELARVLGLSTVAEGIETPEQLATLQSFGCGMAQGFLLDHPGPPQEPPWPNGRELFAGVEAAACGTRAWSAGDMGGNPAIAQA